MGRGAIPSLRRFARRRMRGTGVVGCYPRFPAAIPEEGAGSPRVTQPFATRFPPEGGAVRLACVRRAASVHPEPGSNSPSKVILGADEPVRPAVTPIGSIRILKPFPAWKGIVRVRLTHLTIPYITAHHRNGSYLSVSRRSTMCPMASRLAVSGSQGTRRRSLARRAARRYIAIPRAARVRLSASPHLLHIFYRLANSPYHSPALFPS